MQGNHVKSPPSSQLGFKLWVPELRLDSHHPGRETGNLMAMRKKLPVALTIAGSDGGGGAGIQADLKTFAALGVHGASAVTCITAQNPRRVLAVRPCDPKILRRQVEAVFEEIPPRAAKTGMLFSTENVRVISTFFGRHQCPLVVDPVMVSTSGTRLLARPAEKLLQEKLLPLAVLVTPNVDEAQILAEQKIRSLEDLAMAARKIYSRFGCAALVKGGHLPSAAKPSSREAVDVFFDGRRELRLAAPFVRGISTHGTGCTYSAAICAALALGQNLPSAVETGKKFISAAIANSYRIGRHFALDPTGITPARR